MDAKDAEVAFYVAEADKATKPTLRAELIGEGVHRVPIAGWDGVEEILDALETTDDIPLYPSETGYRDVVYTTADGVTAAYLVAVLREGDEQ